MKNLTLLIIVSLTLVSCENSERNLLILSAKVKTEKLALVEKLEADGLTLETLTKLKTYSDGISELSKSLEEVSRKKSGRKKINKYLNKSKNINTICSAHFIDNTLYERIKKECSEGYFNICPLTFSKYKGSRSSLQKSIEKSIGEQTFTKTDCKNLF